MKVLGALVVATVSVSVTAKDWQAEQERLDRIMADPERIETCSVLGETAEYVMRQRQEEGKSVTELLERQKNLQPDNRLLVQLILEAYDVPRYRGETVRRDQIERFRDKWEARCLKYL